MWCGVICGVEKYVVWSRNCMWCGEICGVEKYVVWRNMWCGVEIACGVEKFCCGGILLWRNFAVE